MHVVHPICCGLDVHPASVVACLRCVGDDGQRRLERRESGTTHSELLTFGAGLLAEHCPIGAMESTGVYWRPVYHLLCGLVAVVVGNPQEIRQRPGQKTDKADARWIAALLAHGLIRPSFLPSPAMQALRELTRTRVRLVQPRTQAKQRVLKIWEETNVKVANVVSDLFGGSGRRMLAALMAGERHPKRRAALALGTLRRKLPQREWALQGQCTEHHARLIQGALDLIDLLECQIKELDEPMGELVAPLAPQIKQLESLPGGPETAARVILAAMGTDMSRFDSAARLAAWAGVCPGKNDSAGKRRRGKARKGNRYLRRVRVQCAWAARKTPSFLGRTFRRLEARLGGQKAAMAVAHKILVILYHLLSEGSVYEEARYAHLQPKQEERERKRAIQALERLGSAVTLESLA